MRASQQRRSLDPSLRSIESQEFENSLREKIVGQEEGIRALVDLYQVFCAGMCPNGRPVGNLLFLGPTGSGKTRIVEAAAEILFGDPRAVIKVDCAEFQHSHEIAKLIGSPPGYLGHRETHPLITQEELSKFHTEQLKLSFLLFDEIEKASDSLWQLLLGMLDKATLTLGDNRRVDLSQVVIFLTSNLGGGEITELMTGGMGFVQPPDKPADTLDVKVTRTAQEAARRKFSPEFMNRLDKVVVFHPLRPVQLEQILEIELSMVQRRVLDTAKGQFLFRVTPAARNFLLREGTDLKYGARHLKRAIERNIVYPLANLLATSQVHLGDLLCIDWDEREQRLVFEKEGEGAVLPVAPPAAAAAAAAQSAKATGGKPAEGPPAIAAREAKAPITVPLSPLPAPASRRKNES
ncbi:MAG TPA: AAA family ATPase [Candidatus Acidoferrales bacterium]|jgi:ATP-dependent Clp protease ATP-binding subunit ClpB|nr:AAA family ATPase [Candidatus Acidoferrales bacterium]